jgi:RES domain-containing protein
MQLWRICKSRFASTAFTGEGARLYSGRWNPAGIRMVYASPSLALAAIEFFVHLDPSVAPDDLVSTAATLPLDEPTLRRVSLEELPTDWRTTDHPVLQAIGANWIAAQTSVALEVPSIAVEGEWNVLLNPIHEDFAKIKLSPPKPFHFDQRMFKPIL